MSKGSLSIQNVALTYGKAEKRVVALNGISFEVRPNEFTVIVGPSGCGKSSLLYIAAGLTEATSGSIVASGRVVDEPGPDRGMVFQSYTLFPWLTVRGNVEYGLKRKGIAPAERGRSSTITWAKSVSRLCGPLSEAAFGRHDAARGDRAGAGE